MTTYGKTLAALFGLFLITNSLYLHRVPGLMGDEASEGQNVYELLDREGITIMGERSYIGPLIDYVRVPFVAAFGYTALALRIPMFLASLATFAMAANVFRRWFGDHVGLFPLVLVAFSLPYLTHQRLAWAITLFPFFFFLTIWLSQRNWRYKWLWVGLAAGLGLHTHIMFAPTLAALVVTGLMSWLLRSPHPNPLPAPVPQGGWGEGVVAFWAAFGTQFVVLQLMREDQGDPGKVAELFSERLADLPDLLPVILSGSSFVAHYTGSEFAPWVAASSMWLVLILAGLGLALSWRNKIVWLWLMGLVTHLVVLLYMIDRFSLRYFLMFTLGVYVLAGIGMGEIVVRLLTMMGRVNWVPLKAIGIAIVFSLLWVGFVLVPFMRSGGSVADFSLGNRTDGAAALVDERPLIACLRGVGTVSSENVHIYNRLLYLSHQYADLAVIHEAQVREASLLVHYRDKKAPAIAVGQEVCPDLAHFIVAVNTP